MKISQLPGPLTHHLISPHGGILIDRYAESSELERLRERAHSMVKVQVPTFIEDDLEMIAQGGFSPLRGFVGSDEYRNIVEHQRLMSGLAWTIPITLPVSTAVANELKEGTQIALENVSGELKAILDLEERYTPDKEHEALSVFRTTDKAHPGVTMLQSAGDVYLAGEVRVFPSSTAPSDHRRTPLQTRTLFIDRGWKTVVGFQTRNPIHRAHEYITKCALEIVDGLLIHPLVGTTKADDIPASVRMQCYEALIEKYYPRERVVLSVFPAAMRYAGPREAILHAIARQNYGCSHFIVGRDHAGVGSYYGTYDAQKLFNEFNRDELSITPLMFENAFYSKKTHQMGTAKTAPGGPEDQVNLSGTLVREMLRSGKPLPEEFSRPEVGKILIAWAQGTIN